MKQLSRVWTAIKNPRNRTFVITASLAIGAPILILFGLLIVWSVNAPFWDQWIYADLLGKVHNGTITFHDFWVQHNEHRIFFPKLIQVGVAGITHWNVRFEVIMNFMAALGAYGFLLWLAFKTFRNRVQAVVAASVTAWLLFSPLAYINWIWGFQFAWYFSVFCLAAAIWALYKSKNQPRFDVWFWVAVAAAIACNYSMGNGLLVWVAGGLLLWLRGAERIKLLTWTGIAVAAIGVYFYHFALAGGSFSALLHRPLEGAQYVLQYLGHNLGANAGTALMAGIVLLVLGAGSVIVAYRKKQLAVMAPWIGLASYGLLTALMAAATRMGPFGVDHSMVFSYTTISVLFVIGVAVMTIMAGWMIAPTVLKWQRTSILVAGCVIGLIAYPLGTSYVENYLTGVQKMHEQSQHLKKVRACLYSAESAADPCLLSTFPDQQKAWEKLQILKTIHWGRF